MKLRTKLLLVLIPILAGAALAVWSVTLRWQASIEARLGDRARLILVQRAQVVTRNLGDARETLRLLARNSALSTGSIETIQAELGRWAKVSSRFEGIYFNTLAGDVYSPSGPPFSVRDRDYFPEVLAGREVTGAPIFSRATTHPILLLTTPLHDRDGQLSGALTASVSLSNWFAEAVEPIQGRHARLMVLDREGRLLAGGFDTKAPILTRPRAALAPVSTAVAQALKLPPASAPPAAGTRVMVGEQVLRVFSSTIPELGWQVIYAEPEAFLFGDMWKATTHAWIFLAVMLLVAVTSAVLLLQMLMHPLRSVIAAHAQLQAGDLGARAAVVSSDEVGQLAASFNSMAATLAATEQRFRTVFEAFPHPIVLTRLSDSRYVDVNPAFEVRMAMPRSAIVGRTMEELGMSQNPTFTAKLQATLKKERRLDNIELATVDATGAPHWVLFSTRVVELNGEAVGLSVTTDITPLKRVEAQLRESENRFRQLFERAPVPLLHADAEGHLLAANQQWVQLLGYTLEDIPDVAHWWVNAYPDPAARQYAQEEWARCLAAAQAGNGEILPQLFRVSGKQGDAFDLLIGGVLVGDGMISSFVDITAQRRTEAALQELNATLEARVEARTHELRTALDHLERTGEELVRSEKMASLGALVAGVAHELNTPIGNAITVSSTLVEAQQTLKVQLEKGVTRTQLKSFTETVETGADILLRNLTRAADLIQSFKQLAVDQASERLRPFELRELAHEITLTMAPSFQRTPFALQNTIPDGIRMESYPGPLGQVLISLIKNALVHAFGGRDEGRIVLGAEEDGADSVNLYVQDDGCGIPPEHQKRIFDPFFTTRMGQGGSGLGLHIAFNLVTGPLGGRITVESHPGKGTTFHLHLPKVVTSNTENAAHTG